VVTPSTDELLLTAHTLVRAVPRLRISAGAGNDRRWELLDRTDEYEAWLILWPSGSDIELHDHGSSVGVMAIVSGTLTEMYLSSRGPTATMRRRVVRADQPVLFPTGHVHEIVNSASQCALSVNVYSPRLTNMTYRQLRDGFLVEPEAEASQAIARIL
jgi:hypothetical protein